MKSQVLFSGKSKKNTISLPSAESAHIASVKGSQSRCEILHLTLKASFINIADEIKIHFKNHRK